MNKLIHMAFAGIALIALTGCGSSGDGDDTSTGPDTFDKVDVLDLDNGFIIDGYNQAGEDVTLEFCHGEYDYFSGPNIHAVGDFSIKDDRVNMFDDDGGSYRIDTFNYSFEVGEEYSIDFQNDEIIVEQITEDLSC